MKKHFVTFYCPGTFVAEESTREIPSWDVSAAVEMSRTILARYDAAPYGFRFTTRERGEEDFNSKQTEESVFYWLGGEVYSLDELIQSRPEGVTDILIHNMQNNGWKGCVINKNSWLHVGILGEDDIILEYVK